MEKQVYWSKRWHYWETDARRCSTCQFCVRDVTSVPYGEGSADLVSYECVAEEYCPAIDEQIAEEKEDA